MSLMDFNLTAFGELVKKRFFFTPAFEIYGACKGLYDLGPPGVALKNNILAYWRQHFVLEEEMLEIECCNLTPKAVLQTSGHVDRFTDFMVQDIETKTCYRADKLLKEYLEQHVELKHVLNTVDDLDQQGLDQAIKKYGVKAPDTNNELSAPFPFNLMFVTQINNQVGYLRPETAQGIFTNFGKLLQYHRNQMPFACATIGTAFRNEISPRGGLLRVREFTLAEIEHFVEPDQTAHPKFSSVAETVLPLYPRDSQLSNQDIMLISIGSAVKQEIVSNETLGYFLVRIMMFLEAIGVHQYRFRQHLKNEMAHYARDCWDAELLTSYGWIECVGCADRDCYDLTQHQRSTKSNLSYFKLYPEPIARAGLKIKLNKSMIGQTYRKDANKLMEHLSAATSDDISNWHSEFKASKQLEITLENKVYLVTEEMIQFEMITETISGENIIPSVIEPSFGIGRILYALLEQSFYLRSEDEQRMVLRLPGLTAPYKCTLVTLQNDPVFDNDLNYLSTKFKKQSIQHVKDISSSSVGKKYVRSDEIGIPYVVTIDYESLTDKCVTLRERDSMTQIRVSREKVDVILDELLCGQKQWTELS